MPEVVPSGVTTNSGQPLAAYGSPAVELERVPNGTGVSTTAVIVVSGAPVAE